MINKISYPDPIQLFLWRRITLILSVAAVVAGFVLVAMAAKFIS